MGTACPFAVVPLTSSASLKHGTFLKCLIYRNAEGFLNGYSGFTFGVLGSFYITIQWWI